MSSRRTLEGVKTWKDLNLSPDTGPEPSTPTAAPGEKQCGRGNQDDLPTLPFINVILAFSVLVVRKERSAAESIIRDLEPLLEPLQFLPTSKGREPDAPIRLTYVQTLLTMRYAVDSRDYHWQHEYTRFYEGLTKLQQGEEPLLKAGEEIEDTETCRALRTRMKKFWMLHKNQINSSIERL
ncbi:hypothetical protein BYT27DRAFT_7217991 [Phlegmacium glaucopus]|nr:hypothetical protein BYT27DRAFT_7217991 [Phlegmacium glaucopus]